MRIGVLSDTHGNQRLMVAAADRLVDEHKAELLIHLGDDYADGQALEWAGYPVRTVPGLWCPEYRDHRYPNRLDESFAGVRVVALHADKDIRGYDYEADVILTGHTHTPRVEFVEGVLHLNPGHLKAQRDRGANASFGKVEIHDDRILAAVYELGGATKKELVVERTRLA